VIPHPRTILLALALALATGGAARAQGTVTVGTLEYKSGAEKVSSVIARPVWGPSKRPGVVLIHHWWGLDDFTRRKAHELAAEGLVVLAVDLYRGKVTSDAEVAHQLARGLPSDRALRDLHAAIDALARDRDVDAARLGVVGWCMGGGLAAQLTPTEPRIKATVIYYGALPTDASTIARWKAATLGNFGEDDKGIPAADVRAFAATLAQHGVVADFKIYPGVGHAFASSIKLDAPRPPAAKDADARTVAFLKKVLAVR
jgi:carboxymethylenebutenolidase